MENEQKYGLTETKMDEQKRLKLIKTYKAYTVVDWIIAIILMIVPFVFAMLEGLRFTDILEVGSSPVAIFNLTFEAFVYYLSSVPALIIVPIAIISLAYTIWCIVLYIRVWPIDEIEKGSTYWFDWALTIVLTAYELFIWYIILFV